MKRKIPTIPVELRALVGLAAIEIEKIPKICGIYFLCREGRVVYIGQSVDIISRVAVHRITKKFDSVFLIECPPSDLSELEGALIRRISPSENGRYPGKNGTLYAPRGVRPDQEIMGEILQQ